MATIARGELLLVVLALLIHTAPLSAQTPLPSKTFRLGYLSSIPGGPLAAHLVASLAARGWREGQHFRLDIAGSGGDPDRAYALAKQLVEQRVDAIVTVNTMHAVAARRATTSIPIVMYTSGFPVEAGVVDSIARPGGNVTGLSAFADPSLIGKYVELLREVRPSLQELGVFWDYAPPGFVDKEVDAAIDGLRKAARSLNVRVRLWMIRSGPDSTQALSEAAQLPLQALYVTGGGIHHRPPVAEAIVRFAVRKRLPTVTDFDTGAGFFHAGGLLLYATDPAELAERAADYVQRVLLGARPAELPIEYPTRYRLAINLKTARTLALAIPPSLRLRADRVIE
jgi:putative ABC transport system substrate-binding protein